jgi:hypothetical protein
MKNNTACDLQRSYISSMFCGSKSIMYTEKGKLSHNSLPLARSLSFKMDRKRESFLVYKENSSMP